MYIYGDRAPDPGLSLGKGSSLRSILGWPPRPRLPFIDVDEGCCRLPCSNSKSGGVDLLMGLPGGSPRSPPGRDCTVPGIRWGGGGAEHCSPGCLSCLLVSVPEQSLSVTLARKALSEVGIREAQDP